MTDLLPHPGAFGAFLMASLALCVTPGPGVVYIVTRSVSHGRAAGLASVLGVGLGNLANAILASLGLAAIFAVSSAAFLVVKYVGAAYLVFLGVQALLARKPDAQAEGELRTHSMRRLFVDGAMVSLMNPKTTLFFAAFVPQFVRPDAPAFVQTLLLSVLFVLMALCTDSFYALASGTVRDRVASPRATALGRSASGVVFIGLGIVAAFAGDTGASSHAN